MMRRNNYSVGGSVVLKYKTKPKVKFKQMHLNFPSMNSEWLIIYGYDY